VHCIPLEEPNKMLHKQMSVKIWAVAEVKGDVLQHENSITCLVPSVPGNNNKLKCKINKLFNLIL
jgi:hypothetical protein